MKRYVTIDGGTTNTRISLVEDRRVIASKKISRGAKAGIDDREGLKIALKEAISALLCENSLTESDIIKILASGMITSEFGLYEVPHLIAPASIEELHANTVEVDFPEICSVPFVFVRGIKILGGELDSTDIMRGEETEIVGLMGDDAEECTYILPGSHSKIIKTDECGRVVDFSTMLTGEMIASLSSNTILKDAVDLSISEYDSDALKFGYSYADEHGLNKALFKVRILKNVMKNSPREVYSFFIGACLSGEIAEILALDTPKIVIGGKSQIKNATAILLKAFSDKEIVTVDDATVDSSTAIGVIKIFEY